MLVLETERLALRTWQADDFDSLHSILSDATTMAHWPAPFDAAATRAWLQRAEQGMREHGLSRWCCQLRDSGAVIGDVGIVRMQHDGHWINDLGYIIHHPYWRKGYAFEAAAGVVQWARAQGLDALAANMAVDNEPSAAVARKLGMHLVRTFTKTSNANKQTYWFELPLTEP